MYGDFTVRVGADLGDFKSKMDELTNILKNMQELGSKLETAFNANSLANFSDNIEKAAASMEKMSAAAIAVSNAVTTIADATTKVSDASKSLKDVGDAMKTVGEKGAESHKTIKDMGDAAEDFGRRTTQATKEAAEGVMTLNEKAKQLINDIAQSQGKTELQIMNEKRLAEFQSMGDTFKRGLKDAFNVESLATMLGGIMNNGGPIGRAFGVGLRSMYMESQRQKAEMKKMHDAGTDNSEEVQRIDKGQFGGGAAGALDAYREKLSSMGLSGYAPSRGGKAGGIGRTYGYGAGRGGAGGAGGAGGVGDEEMETPAIDKFKALQNESASTIKSLKKKGVYQDMEAAAQKEQAAISGADATKSILNIAKGIEEPYVKAAQTHKPTIFETVEKLMHDMYSKVAGGAKGVLGGADSLLRKIPGMGGAMDAVGGALGGAFKGVSGAVGGIMNSPIGGLAGMALTGAGGVVGSLAMQGITSFVSGIGDATKAIIGFAAEAQQAQFDLKKAFGDNSEYMMAQAEKMTKGTAVDDAAMAKTMSTMGMSLGDKLSDSTIASLSGIAAKMGTISGKGAEGMGSELSMAIMSGRPQSFRQIKMQTGIDVSNAAVQKEYGISDEAWKKMSDYEQMMKRVQLLQDPKTVERLKTLETDYYNTINGQMALKEANQKRLGEAFKEFGNYMLPVMKAENGALEIATGMAEPFAKNLKGVIDAVGKSTGISDFVGGVTEGLSSYQKMADLKEKVSKGTATADEAAEYKKMTDGASETTKTLWGVIDKVKGGFEAVSNWLFLIIENVGKFINLIKPVIGWFGQLAGMTLGGLTSSFGTLLDYLTTVQAAFKVLFDVIGDPAKSIGEKLVNIAQLVIVVLGSLLKTIVNLLATGIKSIVDIFAFLLKTLVSIVQFGVNMLLQLWANFQNLEIDLIKAGGGVLIDIFDGIMGFINDVFSGNWGKILDGVTGFLNGIVSAVSGIGKTIIDAAVKIGGGIIDAIMGPLKGAIGGVLSAGAGLLGGAFDSLNNFINGGGKKDNSAEMTAADARKAELDKLRMDADAAAKAADDKSKAPSLKDSFNKFMDGFKIDPMKFQTTLGDTINGGIDAVAGGLKGGVDAVAGTINSGIDLAVGALAGDMAKKVEEAKKANTGDTTPEAPPVNNEPPIVPPATTDKLSDAVNGLNDTVAGKKMDSKIEIYITQTFEGDLTQEQLQQAGATAEQAVVAALLKRGIIGQ